MLQSNRDNSTKDLDKASFSSLLRLVWEDGFKGRNLMSGFRATGLFPLDFNKFPEKAYNSEKLQRFKLQATNPPEDNNQNANSDQSSIGNEPLNLLDQPSTSGQSSIEKEPSILIDQPSTSGQSSEDPSIWTKLQLQVNLQLQSNPRLFLSNIQLQFSVYIQYRQNLVLKHSYAEVWINSREVKLQLEENQPKKGDSLHRKGKF